MTDRYINSDDMLVLEGMYKGIARQVDDIKGAVGKEIQSGSVRQLSALETLIQDLKESTATLLGELKYLSQQSSAIYEYQEAARKAMLGDILDAFRQSKPAESAESRDKRFEELIRGAMRQLEAENRLAIDKLGQATHTAIEKAAEENRLSFNRVAQETREVKEQLAAVAGQVSAPKKEGIGAEELNALAKEVAEQTANRVAEQANKAFSAASASILSGGKDSDDAYGTSDRNAAGKDACRSNGAVDRADRPYSFRKA